MLPSSSAPGGSGPLSVQVTSRTERWVVVRSRAGASEWAAAYGRPEAYGVGPKGWAAWRCAGCSVRLSPLKGRVHWRTGSALDFHAADPALIPFGEYGTRTS